MTAERRQHEHLKGEEAWRPKTTFGLTVEKKKLKLNNGNRLIE